MASSAMYARHDLRHSMEIGGYNICRTIKKPLLAYAPGDDMGLNRARIHVLCLN